ncbi:recombinase family protein [Nonomuraea sp. NPDC050451]|uniref:recombinase family protein n=1 Tax=Nonomuraea sp. NPDC050451 TaxID=3364364 RepID=UPI0037AE37C7
MPSLDRYGRSLADLITMVGELRKREIGFTSLHENLDTTTPGGRLIFHVFAALAEFIRELIVAGTRDGLAAVKARGRTEDRPTVVAPELLRAARDMLPNPDNSITSIANLLNTSAQARSTTTSLTYGSSANTADANSPASSSRRRRILHTRATAYSHAAARLACTTFVTG